MKKRMIAFALALGVSLLSVNPVFAATHQYSTEVDNNISTGDISIALEEYELDDDGNLIPYINDKTVFPGQMVVKIIRITNEAEPAWIRTKAEFLSDTGIEDLGDYMLGGISDTWVKRGDYYYYTEPVDKNEDIYFFRQVMIPPTWDETYSEKGFGIDVIAQAIQEVNFTPDFDSEDPWFGVPIEKCIHTDHEIYQAGENTEFTIVFENGVDGFIKSADDFFKDFSAMMPGDTLTDSFVLGNNFSKTLPITFRTEVPDGQAEESLKLLSDLVLTIRRGDEVIYEGPLSAEALTGGITLASLNQNETETITYSIYMPKELQNASAMQYAKVRWIFSTEYTESVPSVQNEENNGNGRKGGGGSSSSGGDGIPTPKIVQTAAPVDNLPRIEPFRDDIEPIDVVWGIINPDGIPTNYLLSLAATGDNSMNLCLLLAIALFSGSAVMMLVLRLKRITVKEEDSDDEQN